MFTQIQLFANVRPGRTPDYQPCRLSGPIDPALSKQHLVVGFEEAKFEAAGTGIADQNFHGLKSTCRPGNTCPVRVGPGWKVGRGVLTAPLCLPSAPCG